MLADVSPTGGAAAVPAEVLIGAPAGPAVDVRADLPPTLRKAAADVADLLADVCRVAVAFSGGVDSSVMVALAARAVGVDATVAVLGVSPSLAADEHLNAVSTASALGVRLVEVATQEMDDPRYVANAGDRCYFCKYELYTRTFLDVVSREQVDVLLNGDTADDRGRTDRPGAGAAVQLGVRSLLAEAGLGKPEVRALARSMGIPTWDKPAAPCLASRIPTGQPVTIEGLRAVDRAEAAVRGLGIREVRVRHHGTLARVELTSSGHEGLADPDRRDLLTAAVRRIGFAEVEIDPVPLHRS